MAGVRKQLRTGAFGELARLKKLAETVKREGGMRWVSFQQQLVIWDVWVAIGFKRAKQFEKKMLEDGLVVEGYPRMASPVTLKKTAPVKTADKPSQPLRIVATPPLDFTTEPAFIGTEHAGPSTVVSPSPSNRLSASGSKRSNTSSDSPATKTRKTKSSSSSAEIKQEIKAEEDDLRVVSFKAHSSFTPSPSRAAVDPTFLAYLASLDAGGAVDYSIFASDLAHLGIKNHKALERVAATAENRKRLVKDLAKLRSTDKYALIMFEEDLKAKVAGGRDG
ncbi:hypothetical protein JCM10296v2_002069 [Rhodotorula toruloides]